ASTALTRHTPRLAPPGRGEVCGGWPRCAAYEVSPMRLRSMLFLTASLAVFGCERETPPPDASPGVDGSTMRPDGSTMQPDTGGTCIPTPENTEAACSDGIDNDCDGFIDCNDFDCRAFCRVENSNPRCIDGIDNDNNGFTDCEDNECKARIVCSGEVTNAACSD